METITLTTSTLWILGLLAVIFVIFAVSTLVLSIKYESLKKGNAGWKKMYDDKTALEKESYYKRKAIEDALKLLIAESDKEFLQKVLSEKQSEIGKAVVSNEDCEVKKVLCEAIIGYWQEEKDKIKREQEKEVNHQKMIKSYLEHGGCIDE